MEAERYTRFLGFLINVNKTFRVFSTMKKSNEIEVKFEKSHTQTNQGFDINVILMDLISMLDLTKYLLTNIGFKGLFMRTIDHRDIMLQHWV